MKMPYPVPRKYFKGMGLSRLLQTCLRAYRHHLGSYPEDVTHLSSTPTKKEGPLGDEQGTCDDVTFGSCANNSAENCKYCVNESRFEDKNKLAAKKPAPPLMRASVPP